MDNRDRRIVEQAEDYLYRRTYSRKTSLVRTRRLGGVGSAGKKPMLTGLCRRFVGQLPAGEYQHAGMTLQRPGEDLCPLDTQADSIILNGRNGGLRYAGKAGQLALTQLLEFTKNAHRLTD